MSTIIPHQDVTPPPPGSLAEKVGNTFAWAGQRMMGAIGDLLGTVIATALVRFLEIVEPHILGKGRPLIDAVLAAPGVSPEVKDYLRAVEAGGHETDGIMGGINRLAMTFLGFQGYFGPYSRLTSYMTERQIHTARLNPSDLVTGMRRGIITEEEAQSQLADQGYTSNHLARVQEMIRTLLGVGELATAKFRGLITEQEVAESLRILGYSPKDIAVVQGLFPVLPGVQDLITMAVKEAFTPEIAERFGQYQDFPPRFAQEAAKQGLSTEWARAYWAAHWDLPSPTQGFEMLHRGLITQDDLKLLLRALDVMPFWRDKLTGISYNPYTRVDTRRMYDAKIIDRAGVKRSYLDQGYDEEHAENLTIWTTKERAADEREYTRADVLNGMIYGLMSEDEVKTRLLALDYDAKQVDFIIALKLAQSAGRGKTPERALQKADLFAGYLQGLLTRNELGANLTSLGYNTKEVELLLTLADQEKDKPKREANKAIAKSEILSAYRDRIIDRARAITMMTDIGFDVTEVDFLIGIADYQIERDRIDDQVSTLHTLYVNGFKTDEDVVTELNKFNLADTTVQNLIYKWGFERDKRVERPTLSQLIQFKKYQIIDQPTLVSELQGLGYPDRYIAWYVELIRKQTSPTA